VKDPAAVGVGGAAAAVAPYIGAAAVPHGGSNYHHGLRRALPLSSWPTAVGCRGPRSPQRTVAGLLPPWAMAVAFI
jgi:hypothetical protein